MVLNMENTTAVMLNALSAMFKIFLVGAVGWAAAIYPENEPFLSDEAIRNIARLVNFVLIPALIVSSIGSSLSIDLLSRMGILILFSMINALVSYVLAFTLGHYILGNTTTPRITLAIQVSIGSPNIVAFPLMVLQTLCGQTQVNTDFSGEIMCFADATSMLFVYSIGWNIVFWSYGYPSLQSLLTMAEGSSAESIEPLLVRMHKFIRSADLYEQIKRFLSNSFLTHNMIAIYVGIFVGLFAPLRLELFGKNTLWQPLGDAITTLGQPVVCLHTLIMWASLSKVNLFESRNKATIKLYHSVDSSQEKSKIDNCVHNVLHNDSSVEEGQLQEKCSRIETASKNKTDTVDIAEMTSKAENAAAFAKPHWRAIVSLFVCCLILPGLVTLPLMELFLSSGIIESSDRMLQLVIILEAVAPPAQTVIVTLNQLGLLDVAAGLAYLYIFQYLLSVLTITAWVTLAMSIIY